MNVSVCECVFDSNEFGQATQGKATICDPLLITPLTHAHGESGQKDAKMDNYSMSVPHQQVK